MMSVNSIPIVNKYIVEVNETNETLEKKYITTEHFKIKK